MPSIPIDSQRREKLADLNNDASRNGTLSIELGMDDSTLDLSPSPHPQQHTSGTPIRYYFILFLSLLAISCAGTLLRKLEPTPVFLKAFWRLFFISWYLAIGFIYQWRHTDDETRQRFLQGRTLLILTTTGVITSIHFASWIWSLQHTSLAHSLFFVCAHPLLVCGIMMVQGVRLNKFEWIGVMMGLGGSILMVMDSTRGAGSNSDSSVKDDHNSNLIPVTITGDIVAFVGAMAMVGYLYAGKHCRSWLPLFLYAFPVTLTSAIPLLILSAASEDITLYGTRYNSVFGFLGSGAIGTMLLIVIGPGITGHLGINMVLSHIHPLAVSIVITVEPIIGVLVGILFGVETMPHIYTLLGGPLTLIGCLLAVWGTYLRESVNESTSNNVESHDSTSIIPHTALTQSIPNETEMVELELEWDEDESIDRAELVDEFKTGKVAISHLHQPPLSSPSARSEYNPDNLSSSNELHLSANRKVSQPSTKRSTKFPTPTAKFKSKSKSNSNHRRDESDHVKLLDEPISSELEEVDLSPTLSNVLQLHTLDPLAEDVSGDGEYIGEGKDEPPSSSHILSHSSEYLR